MSAEDRGPLDLQGLSHTYGSGATAVQALSYLNLRVEVGEMVAVMGASGSGKSTLLAMAGGLEQPTVGRVLVNGEPLTGASPSDSRLSAVVRSVTCSRTST